MSNKINTLSGERLSFYKLFCEKSYRIVIPMIQRDYAQGRQTTKEVRNIFLDALYDYLDENMPNRDLDFVYGSLSLNAGKTDFIPLDGQQRLTTLFLLHWYLCQISENTEKKSEFTSFLLKDNKSMFTYETRSSSSEFCDALMGNFIDLNSLLVVNVDNSDNRKENCLSNIIKNQSWFFLSWQYDPTIISMLTMLDAIHVKFAQKKTFFERLINTEYPIITFLFLNLKDFKLTDDLYIKMNSRGKPLTSFENFKAKFEQHIENVKTERKFKLIFNNEEKIVSIKEYFSHNIDTKWSNLFWNYRELVGDTDVYDEELKNFIRIILTNQYAVSNEKDNNLEFLLGTQVAQKRKDYTENISYYKYIELNAITDYSILYLIDAFDSLVNGNKQIKNYLSEDYQFYFDEKMVFEKALKNSFSNNQERVLFHAYIRFLIENKSDRSGIKQWMRVIHNLANNTVIDGADEIIRAIKSIEKLLIESNDIINYLTKNPQVDFFSSWQVLEEKIKAHMILKGDEWKEIIEGAEKNSFFDGQIGFVLEFVGLVDWYENLYNWSGKENTDLFNSFKNYTDKAVAVFENKKRYNGSFVWERAVLTKGDYLLSASSSRKNLLTTDRNIRDYSWKRLLRITQEYKHKRQFVKKVFDDELFDISDLQNSLDKICENKTNTWRDYLITCPELISYCGQGFIQFVNENDILLFGQSYINHLHSEMYSFFIWKKFIKPRADEFNSFKEIRYFYVKNSEEVACVFLSGFCHNRLHYEMNIYYSHDNLQNPYKIAFRKSKGENVLDLYGDDIKKILLNMKFEWSEDYYGFLICSELNTLIEKVEVLNQELFKLHQN